jgi:hypothetical protein
MTIIYSNSLSVQWKRVLVHALCNENNIFSNNLLMLSQLGNFLFAMQFSSDFFNKVKLSTNKGKSVLKFIVCSTIRCTFQKIYGLGKVILKIKWTGRLEKTQI